MRAVVSGQASVAILADEKGLFCLRPGSDSPVPCSEGDRRYLLADAGDIQEFSDVTVEQVIGQLELAWSNDRALHLTLILLDPDTSAGLRVDTADCLEEMIEGHDRTLDFVRSRLYSAALPEQADAVGAIQSAEVANASRVVEFLGELTANQSSIQRWRAAWDALPDSFFEDPDDRLRLTSAVIASGTFAQFVQAKDRKSLDAARMRCLDQPPLDRLPGNVQVLSAWTRPFLGAIRKRESFKPEFEDHPARRSSRRKRPGRRKGSEEKLDAVNRQKEAISRLLSKGRVAQAQEYIEELVDHQRRSESRPEHIVKSLCDLGIEAKTLGFHQLELDLAKRAVGILPDDGWALCQLGDAYRHFGKYEEASSAYDMAERCGEAEVARNGKAGLLKAEGRFKEALAAYEATIQDFPANVFARNGKAEVLKAEGRFKEALAAYEAIIQDFPANVFARNGKAEVLKAEGRFKEALAAYEAIIQDFPADVVARNGKAEVLKTEGRFKEALAAYEATIQDFPANVVARSGKAEVLKAQGRFKEALAACEATIKDFPADVVARTGKAEVLKAQGRLEEALAAYETTIKNFPANVVARTGKAEVLKAQERLEEALAAYEATIKDFPANVVARNGKASLLLAEGRYAEALALAKGEPHRTEDEWTNLHIRGMIFFRSGQIEEAAAVFESGSQKNPWAGSRAFFKSALAVVRLGQNQIREAADLTASDRSPIGRVVRVHALAESASLLTGRSQMRRTADARAALRKIEDTPIAKVNEVCRALDQRYFSSEPTLGKEFDEWISRLECELFVEGYTNREYREALALAT